MQVCLKIIYFFIHPPQVEKWLLFIQFNYANTEVQFKINIRGQPTFMSHFKVNGRKKKFFTL